MQRVLLSLTSLSGAFSASPTFAGCPNYGINYGRGCVNPTDTVRGSDGSVTAYYSNATSLNFYQPAPPPTPKRPRPKKQAEINDALDADDFVNESGEVVEEVAEDAEEVVDEPDAPEEPQRNDG